jgi:histidine ammonia-lyase
MLLLRAHVLALGYSGVRPEVIDLMVRILVITAVSFPHPPRTV